MREFKTKSFFDEVAKRYEGVLLPQISSHYLNKRTDFIKKRISSGLILDIGSGTGQLVSALVDLGYFVIGIDNSMGMLHEFSKKGKGIPIFGNALFLPFKSDIFDLVVNIAMLHHLIEPSKVYSILKEMVRVIKPGGKLIIWDHNPLNLYWYIFMSRLPQDKGGTRLIPLNEITRNLRKTSVEKISTFKMGFIPEFIPKSLLEFFKLLERVIEKTPFIKLFCAHNVIVAQK